MERKEEPRDPVERIRRGLVGNCDSGEIVVHVHYEELAPPVKENFGHGETLEALPDQELLSRLDAIEKNLAGVLDLLKRLPEIQAGVFLQMQEKAQAAALQGRKPSDIWRIATPSER